MEWDGLGGMHWGMPASGGLRRSGEAGNSSLGTQTGRIKDKEATAFMGLDLA